MEPEKYFTEKRLTQFAANYKKFPVLWCCWHPKYADQADRSRAYRRLALAQGVEGGLGITRRMVLLCQYFHRRVKQEMARLAAAETGAADAAPKAPGWAVTAEKYLFLKAFARQPAPERLQLQLARGVRRGARAGAGLGTRAAAQLAPRLGLLASQAVKLWRDLRHEALDAVHKHILRGDVPGECAPSALQWAVADLSVLYGGEVTADEHFQKLETLQALLGTFHLVQQYELEPATRSSPGAWARAARIYSRKWGAAASALLLQRRWFELRRSTRARLAPGVGLPALPALPLHRAVADRYPAVVSGEHASWEQLRREGQLARPTSATGPAPGETFCLGIEDTESDDSASDKEEPIDNDVILVEREIETIDVDADDSADEGPAARARSRTDAHGLPDLDVCKLPDTDARGLDKPEHAVDTGRDRDQPTTVSKYFNKAKTPVEDTVGVKQVDRTGAGPSGTADNGDINQDTGSTADAEKGTEKTVDKNVRPTDTTIGDCALTIANIINQNAACSKTNITDSGSKNIEAAVNTSNEVHDDVEAGVATKKESAVSKYSDKTIDDSKEIVDLDKTIDHNLLKALQELDADFVETLIVFECDEDDVKVKANPNDEQITDKGVTEKFNECLETSSSAGQVENESKIIHKVSRVHTISGPKSKTAQLRNRIQFENDEEVVNTKAQDASDNGQLDEVDEASDSRVNNEDQGIKSALTTENTKNTESSEINLICSENLDSHKDQYSSEFRPSFSSRKRRLSESSESDEGLLVIADVADDSIDNSNDRTEVSNEDEEVDVVAISDDDTATNGSPSVVRYPLLLELLKSKSDDLNRYKRFEEIKRRMKTEVKKLLKQRSEEMELDAIATKVVRESLAQSSSRIQEYARNIVAELSEGGAAGDADDEAEPFDEKLLMIPVVVLTRVALPPAAGARRPRSLRALASTRRLLARCRPCSVRLARCDLGPARVAKRVRLPDIDAVRAANRTIATAQVAPLSAAAQATEAAGAAAAPRAAAGPGEARTCQHGERGYALGCVACAAQALAQPPGSRAASELQRRALRRTARLARYQQLLADRQQGKKPRKEVQHAPAPAYPPRAKSPYDAKRALNDWLREKSVVAEKFGIKPRTYKKLAAAAEPPAPPAGSQRAIVTMNRAGEVTLTPPLLLNNCSRPTQAVAAHYVVDSEGAVLSAGDRRVVSLSESPPPGPGATSTGAAAGPAGTAPGAHKQTPGDAAGPRLYRTAFTLNPVSQGYSPNKPTTQIVVTQSSHSGQTCAKMTPKFFNLNCVANINKTLNTLATHEPPPSAPGAEETFLPVITHVESLAVNNQTSPPRPLALSGQTTITPIPTPTSQNITQQGTNGNKQCNVSLANSSKGNMMPSGGFLTTQSGYIMQRPQSETQAHRSAAIQAQSPAIQYNPPRQGAPHVTLAAGPRQANVLQVNSVKAGPALTNSLVLAPQNSVQGQLTMTLVNQPLVKTNTLPVTAVHAGLPKTILAASPQNAIPSVLRTNQMSMLPSEERKVAQFNANLQANGAQLSSMQAASSQTNAVLISSQDAQNNPAAPQLLPPQAAPQADGARRLFFEKLEPSLPDTPSRTWAAGRDPTALTVLAAGPGASWRVAEHIVLCEAAAPRAAEQYYSLSPLCRLIMPDDEDKMKLEIIKKRKEKKAEEAAKANQPSVSWLKVKSFAKMGNDDIVAQGDQPRADAGGGERGEDSADSADDVEVMLRAPPRVYLENKVYVKMSETPLIYAKVLHDVAGPAACRALLLRREPVHLYSLRTRALAPVYGEPSADGSSITLTAAKELFGALHELAMDLAPPGGPAPVHKRAAPAATSAPSATATTSAPSATATTSAPSAPSATATTSAPSAPSATATTSAPSTTSTPPAAPASTKTPVKVCISVSKQKRYAKLMKYISYTPDMTTRGTKNLIKDKSKSLATLERGEGRARARRAGGQPCGRRAGGEPCGRRAGGEPCGRRAGGQPCGRRAGGEPCGRRAGGEPCVRIAPRPAAAPAQPALPVIDLDSSDDD